MYLIIKLLFSIFGVMGSVMLWALALQDTVSIHLYLHTILTVLCLLFGLAFLRSKGDVAEWKNQNMPEELRKKWARIMGVILLGVAAVCPVGLLLHFVVPFNRDILLLVQIVGFPLTSALNIIPVKQNK